MSLDSVFPACRASCPPGRWDALMRSHGGVPPERFPQLLGEAAALLDLPAFLPALAELEWTRREVARAPARPAAPGTIDLEPTLRIVPVPWSGLPALLGVMGSAAPPPVAGEDHVLVWRDAASGEVRVESAGAEGLLAVKCVLEEAHPEPVAATAGVPVRVVDAAFDAALERGILIGPAGGLGRAPPPWAPRPEDEPFLVTHAFGLQWHLTNACDLRCRHCYDRSPRSVLSLPECLRVLDDLRAFCRARRLRGDVSLTGGNPLLFPHFWEVYAAACERGLTPSILGNPVGRAELERLVEIRRPEFFQVSLEGLAEHDETIRGRGHFSRVMAFLDELVALEVPAVVMLTLTHDNVEQVLPLARLLRGRVQTFAFGRLIPRGEGAALRPPSRRQLETLLEECVSAEDGLEELNVKDSLAEIVRFRRGQPAAGGCTGYGCGQAFTFLALLPDGEAHACRKYPSPVGNVREQSLEEIWESQAARCYRARVPACRSCSLQLTCGGCPAAAYGAHLDPLAERDPCCFIDDRTAAA